ncbi:MAG TPA: N-acetylmuramoyl-L-alanine amidase [Gammaproteobacteria bacterium]|nr:N-acetylmuramoyl-L-alanine amidase [Gammaproteobacteria bacterium]
MLAIFSGVIKNQPVKIKTRIIPNLEHGILGKINSIVIHRTAAPTAESTLNAWKTKKSGAHFLIDKSGKIYQTARLDKVCWHMGLVHARCRLEESCTKKDGEIIKNILQGKGSFAERARKVLAHEKKKNYPDRYPMNTDSIGIELVGVYLGGKSDKGLFEQLTKLQSASFLWLITELTVKYNLSFDKDIYAHGAVAIKKENEGVTSLEWLRSNYK